MATFSIVTVFEGHSDLTFFTSRKSSSVIQPFARPMSTEEGGVYLSLALVDGDSYGMCN